MANCLQLEDISLDQGRKDRGVKLKKIVDKYYDSSIVKALSNATPGDFKRLYKDAFDGELDFDVSRLPTNKELKKLDRFVDKYLSEMNKLPTTVGALIKLPTVLMDKFPVTKKYARGLRLADSFNKGHTRDVNHSVGEINRLVSVASGQNGWMSKFGRARSEAQIGLRKLMDEFKMKKQTESKSSADKFYNENLAKLEANGELSALQSLHELMLNPEVVRKQDALSESSMKYPPALVKAAKIWHYGIKDPKTDRQLHPPLKEELWKILGKGLKDNIYVLKRRDTRYTKATYKIKKLEKIYYEYFAGEKERERFNKKNNTEYLSKKVENYFPRQVIDIAPTFAKLSEDIWSRKVETNSEVVSKYLDRMIEDVTDNLKQPANIYERGEHTPTRLSKDVIGILETYAKNAVRFNHNAAITKLTVDGLSELQTLSDNGFNKHANFWSDYIKDTHETALGLKMHNSKLAQIARTLTAWQFLSKIGFNSRSPLRNATQSMQHWVWMGNKAILKGFSDLRDPNIKAIINNEMKLNGYEFVNIQEFAQPSHLLNSLEITSDGKVVQHAPSMHSKFNDHLESVARISGKPMEWVENKFNRGIGFKLFFMEKYTTLTEGKAGEVLLRKALLKNPDVYNKLHFIHSRKGRDYDFKELSITEKVAKEAIRKSSAYAADLVDLIHYNYSPWGKPKILRGPVGSVVGQFSTYSINFFNYQYQIARKAGNEILAGQIFTPETWRLYRLAMMNSFVVGLGAVTNTALSNLIENDTWERLKQFDLWLGGTPEEKEKAFFGKGPIISHLGPTIGDIISFGNLINFESMTPSEHKSYTELYTQALEELDNKDSKTMEIVKILNTGLGRIFGDTVPKILNGTSLPTAIGQELGLYKPRDVEKLKQNILSPLQKFPHPVGDYFTPEERIDRRRKRKTTKSPYTSDEVRLILKSLQSF